MGAVQKGMDLLLVLIAIVPLAIAAFNQARDHHFAAVAGKFVVAGLGVILCYAFLFSLLPYGATQLEESRQFAANQTDFARQHEREMAVLTHNQTVQLAFLQHFESGTLTLYQPGDGNVFELVSKCPAPKTTVQTCALEAELAVARMPLSAHAQPFPPPRQDLLSDAR